jgi:hypothetical protein
MPYRDDQASLEARRDELRAELADADRRVEALAGAVGDKEKLARELTSVEARLRRAGRRLPILEDVRVAAPCHARWEDMTGDDRVRFCGPCQKNVYNLSAMAREEAEKLLAEREGSLCVRLYRRADGTVITNDCAVGVRRRRVRRAVAAVAGTGALATLAGGFLTTQQGDVGVVQGYAPAVMGSVSYEAEPPPRPTTQPEKPADAPAKPAPGAPKGKARPTTGRL